MNHMEGSQKGKMELLHQTDSCCSVLISRDETDVQALVDHSATSMPSSTMSLKQGVGMPTWKMPMRIMVVTICALVLADCASASNLPYSIAIGNPNNHEGGQDGTKCVLHLDRIVHDVAENYSPSQSDNLKSIQAKFEMQLHHSTQTAFGTQDDKNKMAEERKRVARPLGEPPLLEGCENARQQHTIDSFGFFQNDQYPGIEDIAKKWLRAYALDSTDPNHNLDRFREYLRSAQLVQHLTDQALAPDEVTAAGWVERAKESQSQWCGRVVSKGSFCDEKRSLYHLKAVRIVDDGKYADDLYGYILDEIAQAEGKGRRDLRYFMLGYEIPWDADKTLVRYGVTFYFIQGESNIGSASNTDKTHAQENPIRLIGYDLTYANEATPAPRARERSISTSETTTSEEWYMPVWRSLGYPFSLVIGLKNAAFETTKIPFSIIAGRLFGRDGWNYPVTNLQTAIDALDVETRTFPPRSPWGPVAGFYRLLTETPLVGQLFQYNFTSDRSEPDNLPHDIRRMIFLSRGIYGGNKWGQDTGLWALFTRQMYPATDYDVYAPPYRHGTVVDVVWSMFNLSHGQAYNEAKYIMDEGGATYDDRLYLAGHSGGVQRSVAASRILSDHGYHVVKVVGIAGPSVGQALVDRRYPEAFKVYLNTELGANQDVVSKVGIVAGTFTTILDYSIIAPLKYTVGYFGGLFGQRELIYEVADRFGFSNATIVEVERKPSSRHQTPMRLSFTNRLVFDAYIRNEFSTAFKEDLQRADSPHETDRPHAFPWEQ